MKITRRIRVFLGLRQTDVAMATGIPIYRISGAENGRFQLNATERQALKKFYKERADIVAKAERAED